MITDRRSADALLAGVLRNEAPAWPFGSEDACEQVLEGAVRHSVHVLAADALRKRPPRGWPEPIIAALAARATSEAALDALREAEVRAVLAALDEAGIRAIVVKGGALAYTHYERPHFRPRFDTDLLLPREQLARATFVLAELGYRRPMQTTGELVMHQVDYCRVDGRGVRHVFDLHWKLVNPQVLADAVRFQDLDAEAVPIPQLGAGARAPGPVHALLVACLHRVAHHSDEERLIWLFDIHAITSRLTAADLDRVVAEAGDRRIAAVCAAGLARAGAVFGTRLPPGFLERLSAVAGEASATFAQGRVARLDVLRSDLRALGRWQDRAALLREHAFPPAAYVLRSYGVSTRAALPALYAHRLLSGAWKWLRREV